SGKIAAMHIAAGVSGVDGYDAQAFNGLFYAYDTNWTVEIGSRRWKRATGMTLGEGGVAALPNGNAVQFDAAGAGVTSISTISLSFDPQNPNLADTTSASENPGGTGSDDPAVNLLSGEIDGLTSNSSIGSADLRPQHAVAGDVMVMLWLSDTTGTDDRATLRTELSAAGGALYEILNSSDPQWTMLSAQYAGFDTLVRFADPSLVGSFNWDFATHTDVVVDQLAVFSTSVPEPTLGALTLGVGCVTMLRRRKL
ncbi:MAG: hypothetical protein ACREJC_11190, partial [Tepidisphaeraceae bacterium]